MKRIVLIPISLFAFPWFIMFRISFTPLDTAEISFIFASVDLAMILASVVFPDPGGPQSIMENGLPCDTILKIILFLPAR